MYQCPSEFQKIENILLWNHAFLFFQFSLRVRFQIKRCLGNSICETEVGPRKAELRFHCFDFMQKYKTENNKSVLTSQVKFPQYFIVSILSLIICHSIFSFTSKVQIMIAPLWVPSHIFLASFHQLAAKFGTLSFSGNPFQSTFFKKQQSRWVLARSIL